MAENGETATKIALLLEACIAKPFLQFIESTKSGFINKNRP